MTYTLFGQFDERNCTPLFTNIPSIADQENAGLLRSNALSANQIERCNLVVIIVAEHFDVPLGELMNKTRAKAPAAQARQIAIYIAHTLLSVSYHNTGLYFERDRTTVAYACRVIEDLRDDLAFDSKLNIVENLLQNAVKFIGTHPGKAGWQ